MDKFLTAVEALKAAKEELEKIGIILSWELVAVSRSSMLNRPVENSNAPISQKLLRGKPII